MKLLTFEFFREAARITTELVLSLSLSHPLSLSLTPSVHKLFHLLSVIRDGLGATGLACVVAR